LIAVYCAQREVPRYEPVVEQLRAVGHKARLISAKQYGGEVEHKVEKVLFTIAAGQVEKPYERAGIETECLDPVPDPEPEPDRESAPQRPWLPDGYVLKKVRGWWRAYGPDGERAGKGKRTEVEAREVAWAHHDGDR